ncbi:flavodoxin [Arthrobacter sp. AZCC_0090]|uniref:flavodoxin n=1 Tax=Arthrobacter sp. AZCC_0090 TaxID=2735881 RepID=UPI001607AD42|nr:flavodoxin [Arthrobacter sp. AZCC_0090]MBB6404473.1 flavodoxin [Arthrobacter sp. AZCC_0090]
MPPHGPAIDRRTVLRSAVVGLAGAAAVAGTSSCTPGAPNNTMTSHEKKPQITTSEPGGNGGRVLLSCFSRAGENYYDGGRIHLDVGNTEVLAGMISALITCDAHRIDPAEPYSDNYDATVARNVREQNANARPAIATPLPSIEQYDTVLLDSGIWNVRAPMIMTTFAESHDFTGKTIHPITTHAMSGLGTTEKDYAKSCPGAIIGEGLAVRGEHVRDSGLDIESWLRRTQLLQG